MLLKIIFILINLFFSLGQLGRISFFNQKINFYLYEVFIFFFIILSFLKDKKIFLKKISSKEKYFWFFLTTLLFSYFLSFGQFSFWQNLIAFLYLLRIFLYYLFFKSAYYFIQKEKDFVKKNFYVLNFLIITSSLTQYFLYPNLRNLYYLGWDPHLYRMFGVFFDTYLAGAVFLILFLFHKKAIFKVIYLIFLGLTFSRSSYLVFFLVLIYQFLIEKKKIKDFLFLVLSLVLIVFIAPKPFGEGVNLKRVYTIESRMNDYKQAFDLFLKKPVFGYGYNRISFLKNGEDLHSKAGFSSSFLIILVTGGMVGLSFLIYLFQKIFFSLKRKEIFLAVLLLSFFDNVFLHPYILYLLILVFMI